MLKMPIISLPDTARELGRSGKRVNVLWQHTDQLVFMARGRVDHRAFRHLGNLLLAVLGAIMQLELSLDGIHQLIARIYVELTAVLTPAGTPHSPRFAPDAYLLVVERQRREGEVDRFQWYCPKCDALLHEERCVVSDYRADPVSKAYQNFFDSEEARTCKKCRNVMPKPQAA